MKEDMEHYCTVVQASVTNQGSIAGYPSHKFVWIVKDDMDSTAVMEYGW